MTSALHAAVGEARREDMVGEAPREAPVREARRETAVGEAHRETPFRNGSGVRARVRGSAPGRGVMGDCVLAWVPLVTLPAAALAAGPWLPPWAFMSAMALTIYAGFKWLTWREALSAASCGPTPASRGPSPPRRPSPWRSAAYLFLWPGMDAPAFLASGERPAPPHVRDWSAALANFAVGVALVWGLAPRLAPMHPFLGGWAGFLGLGFVFHFGVFHLLALAWQAAGVRAEPIMRAPLRSSSLAELWGRRWNLAYHDLAGRLLFLPLRPRLGPSGALLGVFLASGLVHELVITIPARGGYGLPTLYFALQGIGILVERSRLGRVLGAGGGGASRLFTVVVAAAPAVLLFPPLFIDRVVLPLLGVLGAVKGV